MKEYTCCICKRTFIGYPNNAWPLAAGDCCDECNKKVILERMKRLNDRQAGEENKICPIEKD